jgi:nucleotide-binding universal stress UspA family protein
MLMLVASGGSTHSRLAVDYARVLAETLRAHGARSIVDSVCVARDSGPTCAAVLDTVAERLGPVAGRRVERRGATWREIVATATEGAYDLIVVGEKGHHGLAKRVVLGSTASKVGTRADRPVLVVKADPRWGLSLEGAPSLGNVLRSAGVTSLPRKILVAAALHDRARGARLLRRVGPLAAASGAEVVLLHVMSQLPSSFASDPDAWRATAEELLAQETAEGKLLERDLAMLADQGIPATARVRHGLVVDEIRAELVEGGYDLLCVGGHERGSWLDTMLIEDVSHDLLEASPCSVLVVNGPTERADRAVA